MGIATVLLWVLAALLVITGMAGLVLPGIPGAAVLFAGLVLAAWAEDFVFVGGGTLAILAVLVVLTYVVDFGAGILGARQFGASRRAMLGAMLGIFFGLPGLLLGPFVGAAVEEFSTQRSLGAAGKAGIGATLGLALGVAAKLALAFAMLAIFAAARFMT